MIVRTYKCDDCEQEFEVHCESSDGDPDCPTCTKVLDWVPGMFAINGIKSKALDVTQKIIEEDFGMSNLKDNTREGEAAYKAPAPETTSEKEKIAQSVMEYVREKNPAAAGAPAQPPVGFHWGTQVAGAPGPQVSMQHILSQAKVGPQPKSGEGGMEILQEGIKSGHLGSKARIIAKWSP